MKLEQRIAEFPFKEKPMKDYEILKKEIGTNQELLDKLNEVYDRYFNGYCGEFLYGN